MKKLLLFCQLLLGALVMAQVNYSQNWNTAGLNGWTTSGSVFSYNTTANQICGTTGGTIRGERYWGNSGQFTSPNLTGNTLGQITMSFDYKVTDFDASTTALASNLIGTIKVEYASAATGPWTTATTINSSNHVAANTCATKTITFVPSTGNLFVRFNVNSHADGDGYYYFDNVNITQGPAPTCISPTALSLVTVAANTATVSWTPPTPAPALGYDVYYNTTGIPPTNTTVLNGTNSVSTTATTTVLPSLLPNQTTYYVWVRAKCTASDQSYWSTVLSFKTLCTSITALPWTENFDSMTSLGLGVVPGCWKNVTGGTAWESSNETASSTSPGARSMPNYVRMEYGNSSASQLWTPGFTLTAGTNYEFSFYYHTGGAGGGFNGYTGAVLVNNSQSMTGASNLGTFITASQSTASYTFYKVYYTPATNGTYYFGTSVSSTFNPWYLGLDDFKLRVAPTCLDVQGLVVTNTTLNSTTVGWTVPTPAPAGGYDVYYTTTPGVPASTVTPQYPGVAGPTQQITGLAASQTYYIWVRAKCSTTDIGDWTGPLQVYTNYCLPTGGGSSTTYYVNNITATGGLTGLNYTANTYTAYVNNTAQIFSVVPGGSQNITVGGSSTASKYYYAWIDWNRDMVFDTSPGSNEVIISTTSYSTTPATGIINSTGHASGDYRVRFAISELGQITPCGPAAYGNYVDYTFKIVPCSTTAPTITSVDQITNVQARVNWTLSGSNLNVIVKWREAGATVWPVANSSGIIPANPMNYMITGLQASKAYEVIIIAVCGATEGTPSPITPFSTTCDPAPPFVSVTQITATSAMVSWSATLNATFVLQYKKVTDATWSTSIPVTGTSYMLGVPPGQPLVPFTKYEVRVANICTSAPTVVNPWSTPAVFTTSRTCDMPVPGLTVTYMTTTTAQVQWDAFPGATYVLRYRKVGFPSWTEVTSTTNSLTLIGLIEDTKYEMQVVNVCSGVRGSWSDPYYFTTPTIVYCQMAAGSAGNVFISGVVVKNSLGAEMKNDATNIATTYSNFTTDATKVVNLIQGSTGNQLTVTKKWAGTIENAGFAAWIDFNRDGIFQPTERIMVSQASKNTPITATFDVPSDAYVSMTDYKYVIMRVAISKDEVPVNCVSMAEGEVEDYLVKITKTPIPSGIDPNEIVIYPNPVTTILYVKNMEDKANYKIYNAAGQLLKSGLILSGKVDVSGLIKGVYVIDLQDSKNNVQKKFIKN